MRRSDETINVNKLNEELVNPTVSIYFSILKINMYLKSVN